MSKAIVIGAGIAGLIHAKILSKHFDSVIVLEKDKLNEDLAPSHRKGLPQAHHQHILLMKGRELFENLFPGIDQELADMGAPELCYSNDVALYVAHGKLPRFPSLLKVRPARRTWIDSLVRKRIAVIDNVEIRSNVSVQNLVFDDKEKRVTGIVYKQTESASSCDQSSNITLNSDLVVDCSGRGSRITKWLKGLNLPSVISAMVDPKIGYASCLLKIPDNYQGVRAIEVAPHAPDNPRAAGLWEVEKGTWLLTLIGMAGQYPPTDQEGFAQFAKSLETSSISEILEESEQLSDIQSFRGTQNIWRHFEQMSPYPSGLLVMGDALCAFNPLHGQGLTLIAKSAELLDKHLEKGKRLHFSDSWAKGVYRRLNQILISAWMFAIGEDMRWPETIGRRVDWKLRLAYRFSDSLLEGCQQSSYLTQTCLSVANMLKSPFILLHPRVLATMAWCRFIKAQKNHKRRFLHGTGAGK